MGWRFKALVGCVVASDYHVVTHSGSTDSEHMGSMVTTSRIATKFSSHQIKK